jgi:hypothetical protein
MRGEAHEEFTETLQGNPSDRARREVNGDGSGRQVKNNISEDEESVGQKLVEKGMREPTVAPLSDDQRRK